MYETPMSRDLELKVQLTSQLLADAHQATDSHPNTQQVWSEILFRLHTMVRATVPMLEAALARCRELAPTDPVAAGMIDYLEKLAREEAGHDVWALEGLQSLAPTLAGDVDRSPPPVLAAMVGAQYFWIHHHHPVAILGYIKVVERHPATHEEIQQTIESTGLPEEAFVYYTRHVEIEKEHNKALDELLDTLPLSDAQRALIRLNASHTVRALAESLEEIHHQHA